MSTKNIYNTTATFGQIVVALQALLCVSVGVACLTTGGVLLGDSRVSVPAVVTQGDCLDDTCAITAVYAFDGKRYQATFSSQKAFSYAVGDDITVLVNPSRPNDAIEDFPWTSLGVGLVLGGIAMALLAYYAISVVSQRKNVAVLAGIFTALRAIVA